VRRPVGVMPGQTAIAAADLEDATSVKVDEAEQRAGLVLLRIEPDRHLSRIREADVEEDGRACASLVSKYVPTLSMGLVAYDNAFLPRLPSLCGVPPQQERSRVFSSPVRSDLRRAASLESSPTRSPVRPSRSSGVLLGTREV
jgi:hypothetical protein